MGSKWNPRQTEKDEPSARPRWRRAFLAALAEGGIVTPAANQAGIARSMVYELRKSDPVFAEEWDAALEQAADRIEREAIRRAYEGWDEPVFGRVAKDQDGQVGIIHRYSDRLLQMVLQGRRPSLYRPVNRVALTDPTGTKEALLVRDAEDVTRRLLQGAPAPGEAEAPGEGNA